MFYSPLPLLMLMPIEWEYKQISSGVLKCKYALIRAKLLSKATGKKEKENETMGPSKDLKDTSGFQ